MKKCTIQYTILALMCLVCLPLALAQETEQIQNRIYPDSFLWNIDRGVEKLQYAWHNSEFFGLKQRNNLKLSELKLNNIRERNIEMIAMAGENKPDSFNKAFGAQELDMETIQENLKNIHIDNREMINNGLNQSMLRLRELQKSLPESAQSGITRALTQHQELVTKVWLEYNKIKKEQGGN